MADDQAVKFIERMFSHAAHDRVAILAIPRSEGKAEQRVFTLPQATSRKVQAWLRHLNARDYDIYLCVNPIRVGSGGREKEDIEEVRRLQLDLDEEGAKGLARVLGDVNRGELPQPAHVLRSSKDRYQVLWDTVPGEWEIEGAEGVMRALAERYGGRPGGDGRVASDEAAGFPEQEAGQGRGAGHLGLARGAAGEAGGFRRTCQCPSGRRPPKARAGGGCRRDTTPRASGTGPRRAMRCARERHPRR